MEAHTIEDGRMQDIEVIVNLHKSARGFKPRGDSFQELLDMSDTEISDYIESLSKEADEQMDWEKEQSAKALEALRSHLSGMMNDYGIDFETAIRWDMQSHDEEDREHWLWTWGIDFDDMHLFDEQDNGDS